jgi:ribosomal protein S8
MKTFKNFLDEAKLTYDQQYDVHVASVKKLKENGFEVWSSDSEMRSKPGHASYGYEKRISMITPRFERREMQLQVYFHHNKFTRVNSNVVTLIRYVDGDNEYTGAPKEIDRKEHKTIEAAIKYVQNLGVEKLKESISYLLVTLNSRSIEDLKKNYTINKLYLFRRFLNISNEQDAVKFIQKVKKAEINSLAKATTFAKKFIKKV